MNEELTEEVEVQLEDGELATEQETDDGISLGAPSLPAALEALLLVADEPMPLATLATLTRTPKIKCLKLCMT